MGQAPCTGACPLSILIVTTHGRAEPQFADSSSGLCLNAQLSSCLVHSSVLKVVSHIKTLGPRELSHLPKMKQQARFSS